MYVEKIEQAEGFFSLYLWLGDKEYSKNGDVEITPRWRTLSKIIFDKIPNNNFDYSNSECIYIYTNDNFTGRNEYGQHVRRFQLVYRRNNHQNDNCRG